MYYEFYQDSLLSGFIKRLLSETKLPIYDTVRLSDFIIKGCNYIYNSQVILCTLTGFITEKLDNFDYIKYYQFSEDSLKETYYFDSNMNYYDPETHKYLGEYLRGYKGLTDINLMPFYNCFSTREIEDLYINDKQIKEVPFLGINKTVYLVPIKFNKTYTIAIDCFDSIEVCPIFWNKLGRILYNQNGEYITIDDKLVETFYKKFTNISVRQPITWSVDLFSTSLKIGNRYDDGQLAKYYHQEDNLYMMLQVPKNLKSSIVILEGDYRYNVKKCESYITSVDSSVSNYPADFFSPLSFLLFSTGITIPFSYRLVEYLLENVIDSRDSIGDNILRVQEYTDTLGKLNLSRGVWNNRLQSYLFMNYMNNNDNNLYCDITGFVDKDVEKYITKGLLV